MTYAQGGLISATDYNGLAQTNAANVAWVWGVGYGANGYGQSTTGISTLTVGTLVTATQWTGLFNVINRCLGHQGGTQLMGGGNLNAVAGSIITYWSNVSTAVTTINNNAAAFGSQGNTTTGTSFVAYANALSKIDYIAYVATRSVTFASADAARYFFNAGGEINFIISSVDNKDATARSADTVTLVGTNLGGLNSLRNTQTSGRAGTGGTLNTNNTTQGYRNLSNVQITFAQVTSTGAAYTTDFANIRVRTNGTQGTTGDTGTIIYFDLGLNLPEVGALNSSLSVGINHRIDIVKPETTYLNDVVGTITVA